MTTSVNPVQLYAVVYHHCYAPDGYRVYRSDDPYLFEHPSMYHMVRDYIPLQEAEQLCEELSAKEWAEYAESYVDYTA
jgi:hypothetical protein